MSKSPEVTIKSAALREAVENALNAWITDTEWEVCERQAREKLERLRKSNPEADHYDNRYLVVLAAEIFNQSAQIREINADGNANWKGKINENQNDEVRRDKCDFSGRPCTKCGRCYSC